MKYRSNVPKTCWRPRSAMISPCYGCDDRSVGCHGTCARYKAYKDEGLESWKKRMDTYAPEAIAETYEVSNKMKNLKRQGKR